MTYVEPVVREYRGVVTDADKARSDYYYLELPVLTGVETIYVQYDFERTSHAQKLAGFENTIDIGIFEPLERALQPAGFRGWSGSARSRFMISIDEATPGYVAGPIQPGIWRIVFGLYRIAPGGCKYTVTATLEAAGKSIITATSGPPATERGSGGRGRGDRRDSREAVAGRGAAEGGNRRWFRGDLQSHTLHSDAGATVAQLASRAAERGLDFLSITDHNTVSHLSELIDDSLPGVELLPGMELTTYRGHSNVWGLSKWVDFRGRNSADVARMIEDAHAQGALISINHPNTDCPWNYGWIEGMDTIEIWHALWSQGNLSAVAWWDELLGEGIRVVGVGGSDRHEPADFDPYFPHQVGTPTTWVYANGRSVEALLKAIRAGRVVISEDVDGPFVELSARRLGEVQDETGEVARIGEVFCSSAEESVGIECDVRRATGHTLELVSQGQVVRSYDVEREVETVSVCLPATCGYIRAQVVANTGAEARLPSNYRRLKAITNPIFIETGRKH